MNQYDQNHKPHADLQRLVCDKLIFCGWITGSQTISESLLQELSVITNDATTMILRTTPDIFAFNTRKKKAIELDFKTSSGSVMFIEALPLIHHSMLSDTWGTEMYYVCKNDDRSFILSTSNLPTMSLVLPSDKVYPCKRNMAEWAVDKPHIKGIIYDWHGNGSHDPCFILRKESYDTLPTIEEFFTASIM